MELFVLALIACLVGPLSWYLVLIRPWRRARAGIAPYPLWAAITLQLSAFLVLFFVCFSEKESLELFFTALAPPLAFVAWATWLPAIWDAFPFIRLPMMAGAATGGVVVILGLAVFPNWRRYILLPALISATLVAYALAERTAQRQIAQAADRLSSTCFAARSLYASKRDGWPYRPHATLFVGETPYFWSYREEDFVTWPEDKHFLATRCDD